MVDLVTAHPSAPPPGTATAGASNQQQTPNAAKFFANLLDIINPLQHIPIVSTIYRAITGDEISAPAKLVGGALFGGAIGAAAAAVSVIVEDATGRDVGEHALALLDGDDTAPAAADQLAAAQDPNNIIWNGPRIALATPPAANPELANAPPPAAQLPTPQAANTAQTTAPTLADLLAGAPIQTPDQPPVLQAASGQNGPLLAQSTLQREAAADLANRITWSSARATFAGRPVDQPAEQPTSPAAPQVASAERPATTAQPPADWVNQAIAQAQAMSTEADTTSDSPPRLSSIPEPWIAGAMLQALDKYEALAVSRTATNGDTSRDNTPGDS